MKLSSCRQLGKISKGKETLRQYRGSVAIKKMYTPGAALIRFARNVIQVPCYVWAKLGCYFTAAWKWWKLKKLSRKFSLRERCNFEIGTLNQVLSRNSEIIRVKAFKLKNFKTSLEELDFDKKKKKWQLWHPLLRHYIGPASVKFRGCMFSGFKFGSQSSAISFCTSRLTIGDSWIWL